MNEFRIFQVDKRSKFLGKAKDNKAKREEENKNKRRVILLQKNIRAFLTSLRFGGQKYPLLIRSTQQVHRNQSYIQFLWKEPENKQRLLRVRMLNLTINAMRKGLSLTISTEVVLKVLGEQIARGDFQLEIDQFVFLIDSYFQDLCRLNLLSKLFQSVNFNTALHIYLQGDVHRLIYVLGQLKDPRLINCTIKQFTKNTEELDKMDFRHQSESLEQIQFSFQQVFELLKESIAKEQEDRGIIYILSIIMKKLRSKSIENILKTYKIDEQIFLSPSLKEESQELLKEKQEWSLYEQTITPLSSLLGYFLSQFYKYGAEEIGPSLNIVVEISKLHQSFGALKLNNDQFFRLMNRLNSSYWVRQEQELRFSQLFFVVAILKSYLQHLNDMKFRAQFKYDCDRLHQVIKGGLIKFMKDLCSLNSSESSDLLKEVLEEAVDFISNLYNKIFRTRLLSTTVFEDSSLTIFTVNYKLTTYGNASYYSQLRKIVERSPFLLPIETRFLMFRSIIQENRDNHLFATQNLTIRRGHEFEDAFEGLKSKDIKDSFKVVFVNQFGFKESGFDAGGLTKELLTRVFRVAFDPKFGLFIQNSKKELMPHPDFKDISSGSRKAKEFEFVGQLLGKSLFENIMLGVKFAGPFLNLLISRKNSFDDLEAIDPELYRSLAYLAQMEKGVEEMELTFFYQDGLSGAKVMLLPRGNKIRVTDDNKEQYLNLLINYKVNSAFERQTWYIRKGLNTVIKQQWVQMFNYAELNHLISGTGTISVEDWKLHTIYGGNADKNYINWFWEIVTEFTEEEKSLLLRFVTSCERTSFLGFRDLSPPFTVHVTGEGLPTAHTCSNVLDLPIYVNKSQLKEKLLYAIKAEAGFEFV